MIKSNLIISRLIVLILFFCCTIFTFETEAQGLTVNTGQLNFGTTNELSSTSRTVTITNTLSRTVNVTGIRFYNTYGAPAFSVNNSSFSIAAGASYILTVWFSPRHNIYHNSEMIILNDGLRGTVSVDLVGQGTYSNSYYSASQNLSEESLKTSLKTITGNGYISYLYGPARDEMFMIIDNQRLNGQGASQNTIESVYIGSLAVGYTSRTDAQTNFLFNTEHTFPQSLFGSIEPMKSDLHHLFPTDDASNSMRADDPFGIVNNPTWTNGGSKSNGNTFEPRDVHKGKAARAMFYFVLRYENYSNFLNAQESVLRTWHANFSPDAIEIRRNNDIYSFQNNRNPFVDYPQFVERINSLSTFSSAPMVSSLDVIQDTIIYGSVSASTATDFRFILVNRGNTLVNLSQFNLSHSGILSFSGGGNDTTISPGESLGLNIRYFSTTTDSVRGWLTFQTNVSGLSQVNVPIYVNDLLFTSVLELERNMFTLYPNPVATELNINFSEGSNGFSDLEIYSMSGVLQKKYHVGSDSSKLKLDISDLPAGPYFIRSTMSNTGKLMNSRFIKMN